MKQIVNPAVGLSSLRSACRGVTPLNARIEPWMAEILLYETARLQAAVNTHGSPLNLLSTTSFVRNFSELKDVAHRHEVPFRAFFARKANKCLAFVREAVREGIGIDVASEAECLQSLQSGASGEDLICTAAVKTESLVRLCVHHGVTMAIDNRDELIKVRDESSRLNIPARIAIRFSGFQHRGNTLESRFGFDVNEVHDVIKLLDDTRLQTRVVTKGLHFHLDGYSPDQRVSAINQCLLLVDRFKASGYDVQFLDIGGGLPMCYLESETQWSDFWEHHQAALRHENRPVTYRNHGLGLVAVNDSIHGEPNVYPYYQTLVRAQWLDHILGAPSTDGKTLAHEIKNRALELRCEPGRSVLDGCGMTVARVEFCKRHRSGDWFVGLAMNRTQCRTGSDDFLVDPIVIPTGLDENLPRRAPDHESSIEGFLVGAYCTESELIMLRKLRFARIHPGDLVIFPNTAGYFMHFLESRSHQFPLARNLIVRAGSDWVLDEIDAS